MTQVSTSVTQVYYAEHRLNGPKWSQLRQRFATEQDAKEALLALDEDGAWLPAIMRVVSA